MQARLRILRRERSRLLRTADFQDRLIQSIAVVVPTAFVTGAAIFDSFAPKVAIGMNVGAIVSALFALFYIFLIKRADPYVLMVAEEAVQNSQAQDRILNDLKDQQARFVLASQIRVTLMETLEGMLEQPLERDERFKNLANFTVNLLAGRAIECLGLESDKWTLTIFLFNEAENRLVPVATRRQDRLEELRTPRSWAAGTGHVGRAFETGNPLILADTGTPEAQQFFAAPEGLRKADDIVKYRSIASLPIRVGQRRPIGVLVATSNKAARFKPETAIRSSIEIDLLHAAADMLALGGEAYIDYVHASESGETL